MKKQKEDKYVTITRQLLVDGKVVESETTKRIFGRNKQTYVFDLEDLAHILYQWEIIEGAGGTYAMDVIQKYEKKLKSRTGLTAQQLFQKYWLNMDKTISEEYEKLNKGDKSKWAIYRNQGDYLKYSISNRIDAFIKAPLPIKYGFLYYFFKYVMNEKAEEVIADYKLVPKEIKTVVDNMFKPKKKKLLAAKKRGV